MSQTVNVLFIVYISAYMKLASTLPGAPSLPRTAGVASITHVILRAEEAITHSSHANCRIIDFSFCHN